MAEDEKDSRRATFFRRGEKEEEGESERVRGARGVTEKRRVPGLLELEERIKEKREKCV